MLLLVITWDREIIFPPWILGLLPEALGHSPQLGLEAFDWGTPMCLPLLETQRVLLFCSGSYQITIFGVRKKLFPYVRLALTSELLLFSVVRVMVVFLGSSERMLSKYSPHHCTSRALAVPWSPLLLLLAWYKMFSVRLQSLKWWSGNSLDK